MEKISLFLHGACRVIADSVLALQQVDHAALLHGLHAKRALVCNKIGNQYVTTRCRYQQSVCFNIARVHTNKIVSVSARVPQQENIHESVRVIRVHIHNKCRLLP